MGFMKRVFMCREVGEWGDGEKCTSQEGDIQYTEDESAQ